MSTATSNSATIKLSGNQYVEAGGETVSAVVAGADQFVYGTADNTVLSAGGSQNVYIGGLAYQASIEFWRRPNCLSRRGRRVRFRVLGRRTSRLWKRLPRPTSSPAAR